MYTNPWIGKLSCLSAAILVILPTSRAMFFEVAAVLGALFFCTRALNQSPKEIQERHKDTESAKVAFGSISAKINNRFNAILFTQLTTLSAVLITVFIFVCLTPILFPPYKPPRTLHALAREQLKELKTAVVAFKLDTGEYPVLLQDLTTNDRVNKITRWKDLPRDPWDNPYYYKQTETSFIVGSYGADGRPSGEGENADISGDNLSREEYP